MILWLYIILPVLSNTHCTHLRHQNEDVQEGIYDEFIKASVERAKEIKLGAYNEMGAVQGPQVDEIQFKKVIGYIEHGKKEGATVAVGGERHGSKGYFVQPTVFSDVTDDMKIAKEEVSNLMAPQCT